MDALKEILILIVSGFIAGVINTLAGGGSLLTLPILIFLGLPPNVANGTNRIGILIQSISGTLGYNSKGIKSFPFSIYLGISASIGALIGAQIAIDIKGELFNKILAIIIIIVGLLIVFKPNNNIKSLDEYIYGKNLIISCLVFFFIGIYGGFINAGIGIVIMLFLTRYNGLSLIKTNATKVTLVAIYTSVALALFTYNDKVNWLMGFWLSLGTFFGGWLSSRYSVVKGEKLIKATLLIMVLVMSTKLWFF
ncbi:MAG: integrase [Flavobacteriaceae bacterium]|nr:integrase [Flavobacteriaceae bacterium]|tara:strand:- start:9581 stop:10333 length:753 start_codon:yes stop_codon:yes gene_type:complete